MKYFNVFLTAFIVVLLDQISKFFVRLYEPSLTFLTFVKNSGAAFGLLQGQFFVLGIVGLLVSVLLIYLCKYLPDNKIFPQLALGLLLGGSIGNMIDRFVFGFVTDFINLQYWPVFNVADIANVVGVFALIYFFWNY